MPTEDVSPRFHDLDAWSGLDMAKALYEGQLAAAAAVGGALPAIASAVEAALPRLEAGGRLVYAGAGTSGRIGVQDGAELTPTFDWPEDRLVFAIAGGDEALLHAVENAEDAEADAVAAMARAHVDGFDVVIGIAASGRTPFTLAAVREARGRGALTIGVANNPNSALLLACDEAILVETGEEVLAGSTRLKAGTAQKIVLNLFSTVAMIRLGKVYRGMMVHMRATNAKLRHRAVEMVMRITGCDEATARAAMAQAGEDLKLAALIVRGATRARGEALIEAHRGNLRAALAALDAPATDAPATDAPATDAPG